MDESTITFWEVFIVIILFYVIVMLIAWIQYYRMLKYIKPGDIIWYIDHNAYKRKGMVLRKKGKFIVISNKYTREVISRFVDDLSPCLFYLYKKQ